MSPFRSQAVRDAVDDVAFRIKLLREHLGMTQEEFAMMAGVSRGTLCDIENLRVKPSVFIVLSLLDQPILSPLCRHVSPDWLLFGLGEIAVAPMHKIPVRDGVSR